MAPAGECFHPDQQPYGKQFVHPCHLTLVFKLEVFVLLLNIALRLRNQHYRNSDCYGKHHRNNDAQ